MLGTSRKRGRALRAAGLAARAAGTEAALVARDGFHPSAAGHRVVAEAFQRALEQSGFDGG